MLQQTTVKTVAPRFIDFLRRWPNVHALARAELGEVLAAWAGLGYYARARNLHACARAVSESHGGRFPDTEEALRELPGIGAYTCVGHCGDSIRPAVPGSCGRQYRTRRRAAVCNRNAITGSQATNQVAGGEADACDPRR